MPNLLKMRGSNRRAAFAGGFTLVEMLVALAVLSLALTVVGVVFSVTTKTVSQAAALSEMQAWTRQFLYQIEEDLKYCNPSKSVLVLVGRTQAAALTRDELDARHFYRVLTGDPAAVPANYNPVTNANLDNATSTRAQYSDPRADILGFFTERASASQAPATNPLLGPQDQYVSGAKVNPIFVAYGHAANGDVQRQPNGSYAWTTRITHIEDTLSGATQSILPANQWMLSRRATLIELANTFTGVPTFNFNAADRDRIHRCNPTAALAGDVALLPFDRTLTWLETVPNTPPNSLPAQVSPYSDVPSSVGLPFLNYSARQQMINGLLYLNAATSPGGEAKHHVATIISEPPPEFSSNLALHSLAGCAWFQVEFLMPEDPRNSLEYTPPPLNVPPNRQQRNDMPLWTEVPGGNTYVFVPDSAANRNAVASQVGPPPAFTPFGRLAQFKLTAPPNALPAPVDNVANRRIRMWPYAIRITVRVFDPQGRITDPIERSIVHRFE